jgi:hypothetical protein
MLYEVKPGDLETYLVIAGVLLGGRPSGELYPRQKSRLGRPFIRVAGRVI